MSDDVFPRRNLPADAEPWGRKQDDVTRSQGRRITALELASQSNNRSNAGQLGVIGRQLETLEGQQITLAATVAELDARRMVFTTAPSLSVSGNATTAPFPSASRNFNLEAPLLGRRRGLFSASWTYSNTGGSTNIVSAFSEILQDSTVIWSSKGGVSVPYVASSPGSWPVSETVSLPVSVPASGSLFQLRIHRVGFNATTTTLTASSLSATLDYGDRY